MLLKAKAVEVQKHDHLTGLCHYAGSWLFLLSNPPSYPVFSSPRTVMMSFIHLLALLSLSMYPPTDIAPLSSHSLL